MSGPKIKGMTTRMLRLIGEMVANNINQSVIAEVLGVSPATVSRALKQNRKKHATAVPDPAISLRQRNMETVARAAQYGRWAA